MKQVIIYSLLALAVGFFSCNDFLTEEPILSQSNELTLSTYDGLNKATSAAYGYLYQYNWYGSSFVLSSELRSGNAKNPTNTDFTSGRYINEYGWSYSSNSTSNLWEYAYKAIAAVNNVINNLEGKESPDVSAADLNNLKAECLFLRALSHFDLLRTYAQPYTYAPNSPGVPIVLVTELGKPARNTVAEVYAQIVADLLEAESAMQDDYKRSGVTDVFATATKPAIQALLSRIYLYMGEWQKSADYATKVINSGKFNIFPAEDLPYVWTQNTASAGGEVIFEVFGLLSNEYNAYWEEISGMTTPEGYADVMSSAELRNLYEEGDVRLELFEGHPDAPEDHLWTTKYWGKATERPTYNNIIVLRLSEMYLNRAEALFRGASIAGASVASDLLAITSNRGASPASPSLTGILTERRKELAFEGHQLYDMARTGTAVNRTDYDGPATAQYIEFPSFRWALPIPLAEINANPNCEQNEGY
jgi:hypothetical protein